ncbi:MAG: 1-acyl-sn-glycerol-3-phosphate acyltransferase [Balneolaceae bacterium]|nr:1-acyl-sn-glycerol-3-phosphate acyltransferase [Balneolaceae bacterium]MCH8548100.1 1-acyl-sn-glycerol-3-phosphate acyltransferase [Balneolaceae bacterium]
MRNTIIPVTKALFAPEIVNRQYMPLTGPCFIYGNHSHYFDPFVINTELTREPTAGVMTRDQFHKTIPRIFMDSIGIVPTSKYVAEPGIIRSVMKMIDQERMIVIFPEGGRRWDGRPKPLIETTLKLFWKMKIPVHPVQIHGSHLHWPRWADHYRRGSLQVHFLKPLHVSDFDDYDSFAEKCRELIRFDEYNPQEKALPKRCKKPAAGVQRLIYRCPDTGVSGAVYSPDGERVFSRESDMNYKMDIASRLIDRDGRSHSLIALFDRINEMPMVSQSGDLLLEKNGGDIHMVNDEHRLVGLGRGLVSLHKEYIRISYDSDLQTIGLDQIKALSIEQNHKLTITTAERTFQLNLSGQSALQWQIYLKRLVNGEKTVRSLNG